MSFAVLSSLYHVKIIYEPICVHAYSLGVNTNYPVYKKDGRTSNVVLAYLCFNEVLSLVSYLSLG